MPIYEYRCNQCQCVFEMLIWSAKDKDRLKCPKCQGQDVSRVMSSCRSQSRSGGLSSASACGPSAGGFS